MSADRARRDIRPVAPQGAYVATRCPVRAQNDILRPTEPLATPPELERRRTLGAEFEAEVFASLAAVPGSVVIDDDSETRVAATVAAIADKAPVVLRGQLPPGVAARRVGAPDVLIRTARGYAAVEIKNHRALKERRGSDTPAMTSPLASPHLEQATERTDVAARGRRSDVLQLAHYHRMLQMMGDAPSIAGVIGTEREVVWVDLGLPMFRIRSVSSNQRSSSTHSALDVYDREFGFRLEIIETALNHDMTGEALLVEPARSSECPLCPWSDYCRGIMEEGSGDVTLLPRVGWDQRQLHLAHGVTNRRDLASLDYRTASLIARGVDVRALLEAAVSLPPELPVSAVVGTNRRRAEALWAEGLESVADLRLLDARTASYPVGSASLTEQIDQARAALGPAVAYRRRDIESLSVPRADVEVDVDMENSDRGVYLWGALVTDRARTGAAPTGYQPFAVWDVWTVEREIALLVQFWSWLREIQTSVEAAGFSFKAYCYNASAENTRMRLGGSSAPNAHEIDEFLKSPAWVDVLTVVKSHLLTGGSLSLKAVARLAGFEWHVDDASAVLSMLKYERATSAAADSEEGRDWLLSYNSDDCRATLAVRDWLDTNATTFQSVADLDAGFRAAP